MGRAGRVWTFPGLRELPGARCCSPCRLWALPSDPGVQMAPCFFSVSQVTRAVCSSLVSLFLYHLCPAAGESGAAGGWHRTSTGAPSPCLVHGLGHSRCSVNAID